MMKLENITGDIRKALTKTFYQVRKDLSPHLDHLKMKDIKIKWWNKVRSKNKSVAGKCYKGTWKIKVNGRYQWFTNLIVLTKGYQERFGLDCTLDTFKHELVHLIAKDNHGSHFTQLARSCGADKYVKKEKYTELK